MTLIDSSSIITNPSKMLNSKYEFCYSHDDDIRRAVKDYPDNHFLKRVIEKNKDCILDLSALKELPDLTNRAFFVSPKFIRSILSLYIKEKADAIYWMSQPIFFDNPLVIYYRVGLTGSQIESINKYSSSSLECGLHSYVFNLALIALEGKNVNLRIFNDMQEFIETFTVFGAITLSSLRVCFGILVFCELLVLSLFLCSKASVFLKRRGIWLSPRELLKSIVSVIKNTITRKQLPEKNFSRVPSSRESLVH